MIKWSQMMEPMKMCSRIRELLGSGRRTLLPKKSPHKKKQTSKPTWGKNSASIFWLTIFAILLIAAHKHSSWRDISIDKYCQNSTQFNFSFEFCSNPLNYSQFYRVFQVNSIKYLKIKLLFSDAIILL